MSGMKPGRSAIADTKVLLDALDRLSKLGRSRVRSSDLTRESSAVCHKVPKSLVRRYLTENGDGVTAINGVTMVEKPRDTFWFSLGATHSK